MEAKDFQSLVEQLGELTVGQREALVEAINVKRRAKLTPDRRPILTPRAREAAVG